MSPEQLLHRHATFTKRTVCWGWRELWRTGLSDAAVGAVSFMPRRFKGVVQRFVTNTDAAVAAAGWCARIGGDCLARFLRSVRFDATSDDLAEGETVIRKKG